jgi:predicted RNA-binding protein YlxR (DUF448 family)
MLAVAENDALDGGRAEARRGLARLCLATREVTPAAELIRYVTDPGGRVVPDLECKLPGRGAWVTGARSCLEAAIRQKAFARALRAATAIPDDLPDLVERLLRKAALESLSLANKAGAVVTGFEQAANAIEQGEAAGIIHASDAAEDGIRKLDAAIRRSATADRAGPVRIRTFTGTELDLALGRSNVVHAALLAHPAGAGFLARCLRLDRWRNGGSAA